MTIPRHRYEIMFPIHPDFQYPWQYTVKRNGERVKKIIIIM